MTEQCVFVVDDENIVRVTVTNLLQFRGFDVKSYASAEAFLDSKNVDRPGCLLLDLRLGGMSGLDLLAHLRSQQSLMPIILMSAYATVSDVVSAMKHGAADVLQKPFRGDAVVERVVSAFQTDEVNRGRAAHKLTIQARLDRLSPRETEALELLVDGKDYKAIAEQFGISPKTASIHRANVLQKLDVKNIVEAVKLMHELQSD
ncbi:MAG: response regulator [Planctomycetota bacterium]|nr:response regulator [Planctomycetota bacterium]